MSFLAWLKPSQVKPARSEPSRHIRSSSSNEVVRIATDSIYIRKEFLYKIENVPAFFKQAKQKTKKSSQPVFTGEFLCSHPFPLRCALCAESNSSELEWV